MRLSDRVTCLGGALTVVLLLATTAHGAINISTQATQNMSCSAGVCTATAQKAYLNVNDVTTMLAAGDLKVVSGAGAEDIHIQAPFSWTSTSRLTLDAQRSIEFEKPVSVAGTGALTLITNDGGTGGDYWFDERASVSFWDTSSSLIINGQSFTLVKDIKTLAADIAANPSGNYALANNYDAAVDGMYRSAVVPTVVEGTFEGLGNSISNLSASSNVARAWVGMFAGVDGTIRDVNLTNAVVAANHTTAIGALLVAEILDQNAGVYRSHASGKLSGSGYLGGLVGENGGTISLCSAQVKVAGKRHAGFVGGLVAANYALIMQSFAVSSVAVVRFVRTPAVGGLVGVNDGFGENGVIRQSYAVGPVKSGAWLGGLAGEADVGEMSQVYAIGAVPNQAGEHGGLVGHNFNGSFDTSYWDITTSGQTAGCGPEYPCNNVVGLTDAQLKSALPDGFDPKVWGQDANINNGYPYLLANPPPKNAPGKARLKSSRHSAHYAPHA